MIIYYLLILYGKDSKIHIKKINKISKNFQEIIIILLEKKIKKIFNFGEKEK
jgi:hypothetical protein